MSRMPSRREALAGAGGAALVALAPSCSAPRNAAPDGLADLDAVETAARIRSGELAAVDAVEAAIARARRRDKQLNAIAFETYDTARKTAKSPPAGPFSGVPTFIKDADEVTGAPAGFGSRAFPGYRGKTQTPLIDAVFGLGVISLGKSALPEFGLTATTESQATGATRNPWNLDRSAGGSSGGAAALVAAGVTPIAHGSDGGGSIRIPASCCGLVGLKTSRGRFPKGRNEAGPIEIIVSGALTRTVRDSAAFAAAMERPSDLPPIGLAVGPAEKRLRIGLAMKGSNASPLHPDVARATEAVAAQCQALGHAIVDIALPFTDQLRDDFILYWAHMAAAALAFWEERTGLKRNRLAFETLTLRLADHYEANRDKYAGAVERLGAAGADYAALFAGIDVTLSPVLSAPPPAIGWIGPSVDFETHMARLTEYAAFTSLWHIVGAPAISLPLSMSGDNLPIGAMFGAPMGGERVLLDLAFELEEAMPWKDRKPPIFG